MYNYVSYRLLVEYSQSTMSAILILFGLLSLQHEFLQLEGLVDFLSKELKLGFFWDEASQ